LVEPENPLGVHVRHSRPVSGCQRRSSDELNRLFGGLKGVVDGEHHIVDANFLDRVDQRRVGEHAGSSDHDVGSEVLRGQPFQRALQVEDLVARDDLPVVGGDSGGVDVERDVKVLQGFPEPGVLRLVQVMTQRVIVDQRSAQAELDSAA
jgi:hypothetical protein